MYRSIKKTGKFLRKSLSLVIAFSMMISVCLVSGFSIGVSAASTSGQRFDINLSQNSTWKNLTSINVRFANASGTILSTHIGATKNNGVFQVTAPAGATQIEISSAPFSLSGTKAVASGYRRIVLKNPVNGKTYADPYVHYYGGDSSHGATTWPGTKMTSLGNGYFYCDIHSSYSTLNFSDNGNTSAQTADLSIEKSYSDNVSYYNGSSWTNPFVKTIDISSASSNSEVEFYLQSDGIFKASKYLSTIADQSTNPNVTFATVFVINQNWNSLNSVYATYDYNDPYKAVVKLDKDTYNGVTVFKGTIPKNALLRFHPQASTTTGASEATSYMSYAGGDSTGYSDNTSTYKITSSSEFWGKFSEINNVNYDATVTDRFSQSSNIIGVDATYYDYLSDNERSNGYLNNAQIVENYNNGDYNTGNSMWFPFTDFNKYISSIASANSAWKYPLYFGNFFKNDNQYGYSSEISGLTRYYDNDYRYAVNNSNGLSDMHQSIQGLAYPRLDSNGDIQAANGLKMPYFDTDTLSAAKYNGNRVAKVFKSSFPFRSTTNSSGVTTYSFNSKNAADNVYFTWDGTTPKYVNYGAGTAYGVWDAAKAFGNDNNGYGIYPFNNNSAQKTQTIAEDSGSLPRVSSDQFYIQSSASNYYIYLFEGSSANKTITLSNKTTANGVSYFVVNKSDVAGYNKCIFKPNSDNWTDQTGSLTISSLFGGIWKTDGTAYTASSSKTYTRGGNDNLDFGFGVRLDIDFRVPQNGTVNGLASGSPVTFDYSGDDDLWVYIGTDPTGANAELVLDLGGDHKEATGNINFKNMTATANNVYANYSSSTSSTGVTVPSDEIWVKTDSYTDFCIYAWNDSSNGYVKPYVTSDGFYKFRRSQFGSYTGGIFCKWQNVSDGKLSGDLTLSSLYGKAWNGNGSSYTGGSSGNTNLGAVTKKFNNGAQLDPNTTYHMVVFYMERGLAESNFSVGFTMTPANNDLKVSKALDTADVVPEIANDLKENEKYTYSIKDNNGAGNSSGKAYTVNDGEAQYLQNSSFKLQDSDTADFNNTFKTESKMVVSESIDNSALSYDTSWELVDNKLGGTISHSTTSSNRTSAFNLVDPNDSSSFAQLQLNYTNTIKTSALSLTKRVQNEDGSDYNTDKQFVFQLLLDLDGSGATYAPKAYPVEYTVSGDNTVYRASDDGKFTIKKDQKITLLGLPVGATYTLKESVSAGFAKVNDISGTILTNAAQNSVTAVNVTKPVNTVVSVNKTLDNANYSGSVFTYTITGLGAMTTKYDDPANPGEKLVSFSTAGRSQTKTAPVNGVVTFDSPDVLNFVEPGYYRFKITEDFAPSISNAQKNDYIMDAYTVLVEIQVDSDGNVQPTKYCKIANYRFNNISSDSGYEQFFNNYDFVTTVRTFANTTQHGTVTVAKKAQNGANVAGTVFGLIKVANNVNDISAENLNSIIKANKNVAKADTQNNGSATFSNLVIFENGNEQYTTNGTWVKGSDYTTGSTLHQKYCLFEYSPSSGYNPTYVKQFFTLPKDGNYSVTLDDVVDGLILSPNASGSGMSMFMFVGLAIIGTGTLAVMGYVLYDRKCRKKRRARYTARH